MKWLPLILALMLLTAVLARAHMMGDFFNQPSRGGSAATIGATFEDRTGATFEDHTGQTFEDHI